MHIKVTLKNVYGTEILYPACDKAKHFAALAKTKTLTWASIKLIKALGYRVETDFKGPNTL
jgi:hypothetical protein